MVIALEMSEVSLVDIIDESEFCRDTTGVAVEIVVSTGSAGVEGFVVA